MPDLLAWLVIEPTICIAYVVFGMVGFGSTLVSAPVLAHLLPVSTIVPMLAVTDFIASCSGGLRLGTHIVKAEVYRLLPPMFLGSALGAYILFAVPVRALMLLLGVFVMLYALNGLRRKEAQPILGAGWAWWFGGAGGVLSALFGAGGWVYSIYLTRRLEDPIQIRATQSAVLIVSSFIRVGLFTLAGRYFDSHLWMLILASLPAVGLGLYLGHRVTLKMDRAKFMKLLYAVLLLTGSSLLIRAWLSPA